MSKKDAVLEMYTEIISEYLKEDAKDVKQRIRVARDTYHIPVKYYANHRLFLVKEEKDLAEYGKKIMESRGCYQKRLSEITGMTIEEAGAYISALYAEKGISGKEVLDGELYRMSPEEIDAWKLKKEKDREALVHRIMDRTGHDEYWVKKDMAKCKAIYGIAMGNYENNLCYELTDEQLATYANLEDSRKLGQRYNVIGDEILTNKQLFDENYKEFLGRDYWVNADTDYKEFRRFIRWKKEVFCKPLDLHGAFGVFKKKVGFHKRELYEFFMQQPKMIVEEVIKQDRTMASFYPGSINTVRVFTILKDDRFDAFAAFVRFGVGGIADNISAGGIGCGVDEKTGRIITPAVGNDGVLYDTHPVTGKAFEGFQIPYWEEILKLTEKALRKVDGINYVGWDIAVTGKGPIIVEGNCVPCLSIYQSFFAYRKEGRKYKYANYLE